jgi:drug efflux transport system permease protein
MWQRIFNIVVKEFEQLLRDRQAKFRLIVPTLIQLFIFGYAATFEVYHVATAVLDLDHSQESRELISRFAATKSARRSITATRSWRSLSTPASLRSCARASPPPRR